MKKSILASFGLLLLAALPADAQLFRRPIVQHVVAPVVREFVHQIPTIAGGGQVDLSKLIGQSATIKVSPVVTTNLNATKANLKATDAIVKKLMEKNGLKKASTAGGNKDDEEIELDP